MILVVRLSGDSSVSISVISDRVGSCSLGKVSIRTGCNQLFFTSGAECGSRAVKVCGGGGACDCGGPVCGDGSVLWRGLGGGGSGWETCEGCGDGAVGWSRVLVAGVDIAGAGTRGRRGVGGVGAPSYG